MVREKYFPIVSYAVQSRGPVLSGLMVDNGPALMAAYLLKAGYVPVIFDFNNVETIEDISKHGKEEFLRETIDFLDDFYRSHDVKIAGTKLYANGFADNIRIHAELKRRNPGLKIIAGGPHAKWFGEEILRYTDSIGLDAFDFVCYGDGEPVILPIADFAYGRAGVRVDDIPNLIFRKNGELRRTRREDADLNNMPFPVYSREVNPWVDDKILIPVPEGSRGCAYNCIWCIHPKIGGLSLIHI